MYSLRLHLYRLGIFAAAAYVVTRCLSICPFVRLSVTFVNSVKTSNRMLRLFHRRSIQTAWPYSDGTPPPLTGASNANSSNDDELFNKTMNNPHHTLHSLLPPKSTATQRYQLRQRAHDRQLPAHYGYLFDCNFITRLGLLYTDIY